MPSLSDAASLRAIPALRGWAVRQLARRVLDGSSPRFDVGAELSAILSDCSSALALRHVSCFVRLLAEQQSLPRLAAAVQGATAPPRLTHLALVHAVLGAADDAQGASAALLRSLLRAGHSDGGAGVDGANPALEELRVALQALQPPAWLVEEEELCAALLTLQSQPATQAGEASDEGADEGGGGGGGTSVAAAAQPPAQPPVQPPEPPPSPSASLASQPRGATPPGLVCLQCGLPPRDAPPVWTARGVGSLPGGASASCCCALGCECDELVPPAVCAAVMAAGWHWPAPAQQAAAPACLRGRPRANQATLGAGSTLGSLVAQMCGAAGAAGAACAASAAGPSCVGGPADACVLCTARALSAHLRRTPHGAAAAAAAAAGGGGGGGGAAAAVAGGHISRPLAAACHRLLRRASSAAASSTAASPTAASSGDALGQPRSADGRGSAALAAMQVCSDIVAASCASQLLATALVLLADAADEEDGAARLAPAPMQTWLLELLDALAVLLPAALAAPLVPFRIPRCSGGAAMAAGAAGASAAGGAAQLARRQWEDPFHAVLDTAWRAFGRVGEAQQTAMLSSLASALEGGGGRGEVVARYAELLVRRHLRAATGPRREAAGSVGAAAAPPTAALDCAVARLCASLPPERRCVTSTHAPTHPHPRHHQLPTNLPPTAAPNHPTQGGSACGFTGPAARFPRRRRHLLSPSARAR